MNKTISFLMLVTCLASCTVAQPAWDGAKQGVNTVISTGEDVVSTVWQDGVLGVLGGAESLTTSVWGGTKNLVNTGVVAAEDTVYATYDFVTGPFTSDEE